MSTLNPVEFGKHLKKPIGDEGIYVAESMNKSNYELYKQALSMLAFKDKDSILEIGFGNGKFIDEYFKINPSLNVHGLDFSDTMCEQASIINKSFIDECRLTIKCEDAANMSFENQFFDAIITLNTVYFWDPFEKHLEEIKRVLKQGGKLLIGYRPKKYLEQMPYTKNGFILYESEDLKEKLIKQGLNIIAETMEERDRKLYDGTIVTSIDICLVAEIK